MSALFKEHRTALRRYLSRFVASPEISEDLTQEAFARVCAVQQAELRSPRSFLFRTGHNLAIDYVRRQKILTLEPLGDVDIDALISGSPCAERQLASSEELAIVHAALSELPPKCRRVFLLLHFEGNSYREIARQMELSETMVRKYAMRALQYCQSTLERARNDSAGCGITG